MRCRPSSLPPARQRGAALVVAMLVFALAAALVVAMQSEFQRFFQRSSNLLVAEQAYAYLRGAEDLAALALQADYDQDKTEQQLRDDYTEFWAQQPQPYPLDDGGVLLGQPLEDLQGRFNLNHLTVSVKGTASGAARFTDAQQQFIRLLQALEGVEVSQYEASAITRAVSDWLDADSEATAEGAEDDHYSAATPSYRTANRPMMSVSELRAVANITPAIYNALAPYVTVWPQVPEPLNIHTASLPVLRSINAKNDLSPLSVSEAESLQEVQKEGGFTDKADFLGRAVFKDKDMGDMKTLLLGETSSYFQLRATVKLAERNTHLYSVLQRKDRRVKAVVRASGSL